MSSPGDMRLFVAVYPPEAARRQMIDALGKIEPQPDARHRVAPLEQVHLTLQFIGDTPGRDLEATLESVRRSAAGIDPFPLTPIRLITLPERGQPRLIALETDSPPGMAELHRRLVRRLARSNRSGERFRPHLTLCRFDGAAHPSPVNSPVALPPFGVAAIHLVRSILRPNGAEHLTLEAVSLG